MKLTIEHLAPYLPYGLKFVYQENTVNEFYNLVYEKSKGFLGLNDISLNQALNPYKYQAKPILRPLYDLCNFIDNNENNTTYAAYLKLFVKADRDYVIGNPTACDYETVIQLLKWHFDVFGLIDQNLAIDINTLEP